ncbi:MAG: FCD domain-containing protein, partial [Nocardioidaceae bacterium]
RGVRVRRLTRADARNVYEQRVLLEPWAVAEATRSGRADFTAADRACAQSDALLEVEDWTAMVLMNRRFHRALYSQCPNPMVVATLDAMQDLTALATLSVFWEISPTAAPEHEEHRETLRLANAGEADAAADVMRIHISKSIQRVDALDADP